MKLKWNRSSSEQVMSTAQPSLQPTQEKIPGKGKKDRMIKNHDPFNYEELVSKFNQLTVDQQKGKHLISTQQQMLIKLGREKDRYKIALGVLMGNNWEQELPKLLKAHDNAQNDGMDLD
jgi:hypothetical protein